MEDNTSIANNLEMRQSGRNEGPMVVIMDKSSKSFLCVDDEESEEQLENH